MVLRDRAEAIARLRPYVERARGFFGWSFNSEALMRLGPELPWDYMERASELLADAATVLDMGTGGGEVFSVLCSTYAGRAVATEEWEINVPVAAERLSVLGVDTVRCRSVRLPFRNAAFDLVLNRHEELDPAEVARVLASGGRVLTQQVGRDNWKELRAFFPRMVDFDPLFERYQEGFRASNLSVVQARDHDTQIAFRNLGELTFMLCVSPWTIPGFSPLRDDLDALLALERQLSTSQGIPLTESRFLIEARKVR